MMIEALPGSVVVLRHIDNLAIGNKFKERPQYFKA